MKAQGTRYAIGWMMIAMAVVAFFTWAAVEMAGLVGLFGLLWIMVGTWLMATDDPP